MHNVLSIQSHVVYGHAGNSAAVFPMRRVGVEVWPLNTVQFSNHTQYPEGWKGMVMTPQHLVDIVDGLAGIDRLAACDAVLTGYIGSAEQGEKILAIVARVKSVNARARFFCDPVMGHPVKGCKVAPGVAEFHRDHSVKAADMMSPNVLELGTLVGRELDDVPACLAAAREVCARGPKMLLVKHLSYAAADPNAFEMILATRDEAWHISRPLIEFDRQPVGVGDLTSGLMLASLLKGMTPREALEFTAASVYEVMLATRDADAYELQLVAAQDRLAKPEHRFDAVRLSLGALSGMNDVRAPLYAGVVVEAPLTRIFHYRVPPRFADVVRPGDRAEIPFANRRTRGVVVSLSPSPPIDPKRIKDLLAVSPEEERIPEELLSLAQWVAAYYNSGWGSVLAAAIPGAVKHGRRERHPKRIELIPSPEEAEKCAGELARRAPRQADALRAVAGWFAANPGGVLATDATEIKAAAPPAMLKLLAERGLLRVEEALPRVFEAFPEKNREIILSAEQEAAVGEMSRHLATGGFKSFLLHGVTGSGKTEVYIRLIEQALAAGRGALVLVPEISLTPQTVSRFQKRFGDIAVLHSNLADGERAGHWRRLCSGELRLAVGARSAVFAPVRNLGLVVVDEEHERSYKQDNDPRYNARDVAIMRAHMTGAVIVLGSATPSLESWRNATVGKHALLSMPSRPGGAAPPHVEVVDLRAEWADVKRPTLFSRKLERALAECLKRREQAILFLNRRGFHTSVRCAACGEAVECPNCDVAMTHHRGAGLLRCGCCGFDQGVPAVCPTCGSQTLKFIGTGTERVEDVLAGIFPGARLLRMDSDSMSARDAHRSSLAAFARGDYDILLGTQMVAKGLDFPNVTLVGVLMADGALGMSDFRAAERTFQLVTQVIGRAGRAGKAGRAVVQAFQPEHPAVACAVAQDYHAFVESELPDRGKRGYPPFGRLTRLVFSGEKEDAVREKAAALGTAIKAHMPSGCRLLGPSPCEVERLQGVYRRHMLLFAANSRIMAQWLDASGAKPGTERGVRTIVDSDPVSML